MTRFNPTAALFGAVLMALAAPRALADATLTIQVNQPGAIISSNLFGIFFEEINYAGEGGVYAELVRNRAFYSPTNAYYWTLVTQGAAVGTMSVDSTRPLNTNIPNSLRLTMQSGSGTVGAANSGFWGMSLQAGATYDLSFYACGSNNFSGTLGARLESADGSRVYAQTAFSGLTPAWRRFAISLVPSGTDTNARIVLSLSQPGTVWLDMVSLFPRATFSGRTNGLRLDLANMLAGLKPSFLRFPGGNYIESSTVSNAVRWKKSIGDVALRPGHLNDSWGYWSTDGFGAHEFFQYCEDMGMEPLYGINCGLMLGYNGNTNNTVPLDQMGPWVQDALDLIEYANGDTNTSWGAQRAANGHPAPFNLKFLEIGNENGGSYYDARYTLFYDAIKAKYPNVRLISPVWGGSPTSRPVELKDEHYYSSPSTFISYATKYDSYSRSGPKVFVGEYAVTSGYGAYGNLAAALGEAAFMTGMERNADVVQLASYAPLFANVNGIQWHPDLIYYDSSRMFGTPSYYVQQLFSRNRGDVVLPTAIGSTSAASGVFHGAIGLGSWSTAVQYTNIVVTSNGVTLYQSDFVNQGTNGWRVYNGTWSANAGLYQQTSASATDCRASAGDTNWASYTISLSARKMGGSEGFLILFNWLDDSNWTWWNVGGWGNTLDGIEQMVGGGKSTLAQVSQTAIATNTWYDIRIVLTGARIQCYLNGALTQDVSYPSGLLASSSYARAAGQIIVKAVNPYSQPMATTFNLSGVNSVAPTGTLIQLASGNAADENSLAAPTYVFPVTNTLAGLGTNFALTLPGNSLSIIKLATTDINNYTNLLLQFPSPITNGQSVAATVWGQQSGAWANLTTNANHALAYSSMDTNVAVVDANGNVTGVSSGATGIMATYGALGLSATQAVQVVGLPIALVHRYSFSEASGTNVADSVGGAAWAGTLPRGGVLGGGQLALAAASQQYVNLPPGILSNYAVVTLETWATFGTLPSACFLYGFGNSSGNTGVNYIFCQPKNGRIAITATSWGGEQNTPNVGDWSGQNVHVTSVFNPPLGYLALYTNGILASQNSAVTVPLSSVNDVFSYIARSLYSGDSYFDVSLDEFRIYNGALSPAQIAATDVLGPDAVLSGAKPPLNSAASAGNLILTWPAASAGFVLESRTNLASGAWTTVSPAPQLDGLQWKAAAPMTGYSRFFRLRSP